MAAPKEIGSERDFWLSLFVYMGDGKWALNINAVEAACASNCTSLAAGLSFLQKLCFNLEDNSCGRGVCIGLQNQ